MKPSKMFADKVEKESAGGPSSSLMVKSWIWSGPNEMPPVDELNAKVIGSFLHPRHRPLRSP
ncbi:MAG: hypothetical protein IPL64_16000 [Flavobacteriales bacterium]|nr:hypothetical protein [Flavobacteriales bacterium]